MQPPRTQSRPPKHQPTSTPTSFALRVEGGHSLTTSSPNLPHLSPRVPVAHPPLTAVLRGAIPSSLRPPRSLPPLRTPLPHPAHLTICAHKTVAARAISQISHNFFYPRTHNTLQQSKHPLTDRVCAHKSVPDRELQRPPCSQTGDQPMRITTPRDLIPTPTPSPTQPAYLSRLSTTQQATSSPILPRSSAGGAERSETEGATLAPPRSCASPTPRAGADEVAGGGLPSPPLPPSGQSLVASPLFSDLLDPTNTPLQICLIHDITLDQLEAIVTSTAFKRAAAQLQTITSARTDAIESNTHLQTQSLNRAIANDAYLAANDMDQAAATRDPKRAAIKARYLETARKANKTLPSPPFVDPPLADGGGVERSETEGVLESPLNSSTLGARTRGKAAQCAQTPDASPSPSPYTAASPAHAGEVSRASVTEGALLVPSPPVADPPKTDGGGLHLPSGRHGLLAQRQAVPPNKPGHPHPHLHTIHPKSPPPSAYGGPGEVPAQPAERVFLPRSHPGAKPCSRSDKPCPPINPGIPIPTPPTPYPTGKARMCGPSQSCAQSSAP